MLRNLGIRWQILVALVLPVVVLAGTAAQFTYQALRDMREARQSLELSQAATMFDQVVTGLATERLVTITAMTGEPAARKQLAQVRAAVDQGLQQLRQEIIAGGRQGDFTPEAQEIVQRSVVAHESLPTIREQADSGTIEPSRIIERYSAVIAVDVNLPGDIALTLSHADERQNFQRYALLSTAVEAMAQEQLAGLAVLQGRPGSLITAAEVRVQETLSAFDRVATPEHRVALARALQSVTAADQSYSTMKDRLERAGTTKRALRVDPAKWIDATRTRIGAITGVLSVVAADGVAIAQAEYDGARTRALITLGAGVAAILTMILVALFMARRISRPLRRLTVAATQVRDELPILVERVQHDEDVEVELPAVGGGGRNEVERLAAAFHDVNAVTLRIAREQALLRAAVAGMFVNVARRSQALLSRQLSFIDHLERTEENPDALENLFRLDHLAARMRRNAESLLVLAGVESGRRLRQAMPLSDVVRTATSEIEHYDRVSLVMQIDPPVYPHLALPTAHMLAELLENATNFSDPGSSVIVSSSPHEDGVRLTITDSGLGMSDEELAEANDRIASPPASEGIGSQRLGFFVVGRLAQRLDARVQLRGGRARGTIVTVDLPVSMFEEGTGAADAGRRPEAPAAEPEVPAEVPAEAVHVPAPMPASVSGPPPTIPHPAVAPEALVSPAPSPPIPLPGQEPPAAPAPAALPRRGRAQAAAPAEPVALTAPPQDLAPPQEMTPAAPAAPAEPVAPPAAPSAPPSVPAPAGPPSGTAYEPAVEPAGDRPGLFSGFRSRRDTPPPPEAPPAPEPPELVMPAEPAATGEPAMTVEAPSARSAPPVPPAPRAPEPAPEPLRAPEPPPVAEAPPAPEVLPVSEAPAPVAAPLAPPLAAPLAPPLAPPVLEPVAPEAEDLEAEPEPDLEPAGPEAPESGAVAEPPAGAPWPTRPVDILPSRRPLRSALRRTRKPTTPVGAAAGAEQPSLATEAPDSGEEAVVPAPRPGLHTPPPPRGPVGEIPAGTSAPAGGLAAEDDPWRGGTAEEDHGPRSSIASAALTELSRLSSYRPATLEDEGRPTLRRRTPAPVPAPGPEPGAADEAEMTAAGQRARSAANVRSMLAGFKAGVERGRTSPAAHRPAPPVSEARRAEEHHESPGGVPPQRPGGGGA